ncbi:hypothetical protein ACRAWD_20740 [Caulobacter segnis]
MTAVAAALLLSAGQASAHAKLRLVRSGGQRHGRRAQERSA